MINKFKIVHILRYLWLIIAAALVLYIISQNIITERSLVYNLNWQKSISPNITGWYPEARTLFNQESNNLMIVGEPVYLQVYFPIHFKELVVKGKANFTDEDFLIGLRQKDGSWFFKQAEGKDIILNFPLDNAQIKRNKIELILSVPNMSATSSVSLENNWQLILDR